MKNWTYKSTLNSVENDNISILAIFETIIAIILALYIWKYNNSFLHIYIGLLISPFLLLRTKKSTKDGLILFNKLHRFIDFKYNKTISYFFIIIFYSTIGYSLLNLQYLTIYFILILCCIFTIELFHRKIIKDINILSILTSIIEIIPSTLISIAMLILLSILVKVFSTIKNISFESIKSIPINWKKIIFEIDIFYPPELLPGIEKSNFENLSGFKSSNILIILKLDISTPYRIYVIFNYLLFLIPALIYRYSLKATALVYIPLIWLVPINNTFSTQYLKENSKTLLSYIMFFYSLFVIFILTLIPLYLHFQAVNLIEHFPSFISNQIYQIFFVTELNLWHITRFFASCITIYIFINFEKILIKREDNSINEDSKYNSLIILDVLRKIFTLFTLICTLYLFYINLDIPDNIFKNIKFLPW